MIFNYLIPIFLLVIFITLQIKIKNKKTGLSVALLVLTILTSIYLLFNIAGLLFLQHFMRSHEYSPERIFKRFFADPIPESVELLRGEGFSWQGYHMELVFAADSKTLKELTSSFVNIPNCIHEDCFSLDSDCRVDFDENFDNNLSNLDTTSCFFKKSEWRDGRLFLFWDKTKNIIYFHGGAG